ncbi:N-formylglutamate amidohydrolase [Paraburkholderia sartisoli]|uniref:N-formylglutamate amidohydrolase n=1 Tax=Paraburkholderia sartisoli TaxID=83784 RepID=A0A1H4HD87_9BURK|nr:N-formylglutamate amidohydrolase [Paraburkholderia sartisoli]SEB19743.1 N-formylglutamate amidohydrolase [Paraburkholderia sartisoli]
MQNLPYGQISQGDAPVLVVTPHTGTSVPAGLRVNPAWLAVEGRLADPFGAILRTAALKRDMTCISALYHPCVIDLNVAPDSRPLSSRLNHVGLCRTHTSRGEALYPEGQEPSEADVNARVEECWKPFHAALLKELLRLRSLHDNVLLLVSHASSWLSPYREQPGAAECNIGTNRGAACDRRLVAAITKSVQESSRSWVVNGKLVDAFAAQHYGMPLNGVHAIEVEVAGRWRLDCEPRDAAFPGGGANEDAAPGNVLDALDAVLRTMSRNGEHAHFGSGPEGRQ